MKRSLKALRAGRLETQELKLVYKSYDIVGDIAVIRLPESLKQHSKIIAEAIMQTHKRVKTVLLFVQTVIREDSNISTYLTRSIDSFGVALHLASLFLPRP